MAMSHSMMMDANNRKQQAGQSLIEFIFFLPIIMVFLFVLIKVWSAINSSINQQKAARSYTFYVSKGNSLGLKRSDVQAFAGRGFTRASSYGLGWREYGKSEEGEYSGDAPSFSPCFTLGPFKTNPGEDCENPTAEVEKTSIVRVHTYYGICGQSFVYQGNSYDREFMTAHNDTCINF